MIKTLKGAHDHSYFTVEGAMAVTGNNLSRITVSSSWRTDEDPPVVGLNFSL